MWGLTKNLDRNPLYHTVGYWNGGSETQAECLGAQTIFLTTTVFLQGEEEIFDKWLGSICPVRF